MGRASEKGAEQKRRVNSLAAPQSCILSVVYFLVWMHACVSVCSLSLSLSLSLCALLYNPRVMCTLYVETRLLVSRLLRLVFLLPGDPKREYPLGHSRITLSVSKNLVHLRRYWLKIRRSVSFPWLQLYTFFSFSQWTSLKWMRVILYHVFFCYCLGSYKKMREDRRWIKLKFSGPGIMRWSAWAVESPRLVSRKWVASQRQIASVKGFLFTLRFARPPTCLGTNV